MTAKPDLARATAFLAGAGRVLDRRRLDLVAGRTSPAAAVAAVDAYRNDDGGYGWGLEPDLRSPESQPGGALHAFEVFAEAPTGLGRQAVDLCDWLATASRPDGGLPFALPVTDDAAVAPFWAGADQETSSLQITAAVAAQAHRVAAADAAVADHPWLRAATDYCLAAAGGITETPFAIEFMFTLQFLDAVYDREPAAAGLLADLRRWVPADGVLPVVGGSAGEAIRPLDVAPWPDRPVRSLFATELVDAELDRLAGAQEDDGGWTVDFASYSPAAALDWRGYTTVRALLVLAANGRL